MRYHEEEQSMLADVVMSVAEVLFLVLLALATGAADAAGLWWLAAPLALLLIVAWSVVLFAGAF